MESNDIELEILLKTHHNYVKYQHPTIYSFLLSEKQLDQYLYAKREVIIRRIKERDRKKWPLFSHDVMKQQQEINSAVRQAVFSIDLVEVVHMFRQ